MGSTFVTSGLRIRIPVGQQVEVFVQSGHDGHNSEQQPESPPCRVVAVVKFCVLHANKTRIVEFGRYAEQNRRNRGDGKPETFNFLGFTQ
jgi:hypothetical protein